MRRSMTMGTATSEEWELFHEIDDMDGCELPAAWLEDADNALSKLKARNAVEVSAPHGPHNAWIRATIHPNLIIPG